MTSAPVVVPLQPIRAAAAAGLIDGFVLREGTDHGAVEVSHDEKVALGRRQLESGEVWLIAEFRPDEAKY